MIDFMVESWIWTGPSGSRHSDRSLPFYVTIPDWQAGWSRAVFNIFRNSLGGSIIFFTEMKLLLNLFVQWVGFTLLWLLFVFQAAAVEVFVGAAASALTVFALQSALRSERLCFQPRLRWLAQAWRLPGMIAVDLWVVLKALARLFVRAPSQGLFQLGRFNATAEDCRASAQRTLTILYVSTSPNSVVIDIDREKANLLIHQLEPAPITKLVRKLEE